MSPEVATRATTAAATVLLAVGLALSTHGALNGSGAHAMAGAAVTFTAITAIALCMIRRWVTNTSAERARLARAEERAEEKQLKFVALQGALQGENARIKRDLEAERAQGLAALEVRRAALEAQFEKDRFQIETKAFQTGVLFERAGMLEPDAPIPGNLIQFPKQHPEPDPEGAPQRERSREHGVVGP
ncbi:hypothetical protein [Streptomyces sp. NPDC091215]|uniref:hypothetical protein n=1 Tax=Streptomyces sp. NPDC091215 TaxID=3155192 RepID=UPI003435A228